MEISTKIKNLANRVIQKYDLVPPIDLEELVKRYADLSYENIPFDGVDGISLNLKVPKKRAHVIVQSENPSTRQRFTLAHELGHILIPWHTGNIVDVVNASGSDSFYRVEQEADLFAAHMLIPDGWLSELLEEESNLALIHKKICKDCQASPLAAAIRLQNQLPKNIVYAIERSGIVTESGRTFGTLANALPFNQPVDPGVFNYATEYEHTRYNSHIFHWWQLPSKITISAKRDIRSWREILDQMVSDLGISKTKQDSVKSSINGVIAYANGVAKQQGDYCVDSIISAATQRFRSNNNLQDFCEHPDFNTFLLKKANDLVER